VQIEGHGFISFVKSELGIVYWEHIRKEIKPHRIFVRKSHLANNKNWPTEIIGQFISVSATNGVAPNVASQFKS
jgi:hypothetical protein